MNLNIGCGFDSWGDIRLDVIKTRVVNLLADAQALPFRDNVFEKARLIDVLEHCKRPEQAFSEARRVSKSLHAKFPYKHDRVGDVLCMISSLHPQTIYNALHDCFWHIMTQFKIADHPMAHRWLIPPFGEYKLIRLPVPSFFIKGRKSRYLSKFVFWIDSEFECDISFAKDESY